MTARHAGDRRPDATPSDEVVVLLNRAIVVTHAVRTAAHELNNALQMISGSAELMGGLPDLPPRARPRLEAILRQAVRASTIADRMAGLARPTSLSPASGDLSAAIEHVMELRRYEHDRAGIAVVIEPSGAAGEARAVKVPPGDLHQMILSLLLNAEQAVVGTREPEISLTVEPGADSVVLRIADNGAGFQGDAVSAFDPFVTTRQVAAGLGLTAVRILAERHSGSVAVSDGADGGVEVRLRLPAGGRSDPDVTRPSLNSR